MPSRRRLLATAGATATVGLAGCSAANRSFDAEPLPGATPTAADWPALRYDARNAGWNAGADPPRDRPDPRWATDVGWGFRPLIRGTCVVLQTYDGVTALRATDGERVWTAGNDGGFRQPTLGARCAFFPADDCVRGFDLETGAETWRQRECVGANTAAPAVARGRLYLSVGNLAGYDAEGRATWATYLPNVPPTPAVVGDTVYATAYDRLVALDAAATPSPRWPWESDDADLPYVADDRVVRWRRDLALAGARFRSNPTVVDGTVYAAVEDTGRARLDARDAETGDRQWRFMADAGRNGGLSTAPICDGERVYVGCDDGRLYAVADGGAVWSRSLDALPNRTAGGADTLFVGTYGGDGRPSSLYALDAATGETRWQIEYDDEVRGVSVAGGTVYATVVTDREPGGDITGTTVYAYG